MSQYMTERILWEYSIRLLLDSDMDMSIRTLGEGG